MKLHFTKMQGAGNDFVVLDATRAPIALSDAQMRALGDRRFGVGADQILMIEPSSASGIDFGYRIFNGGSGDEVEHCGNGARCFVRYVRDKGLSQKSTLRVSTMNNVLELQLQDDGRVTVDMNAPIFDLARVPFDATGLSARRLGDISLWPLDVNGQTVEVAVLSMGNPHAVQIVADVDTAPVATHGPLVETHIRFPRHVNAGFMQIVNRSQIRLRVHERGAGETLACGTGACAAVVAGIRLGLLDARVDVQARGGKLTIEWQGGAGDTNAHVLMTGPATSVFEGEIEL
ncbi:MAG: diaminopimelate epimerase [Burkholderiales bacterium]|nr:diaminopimelate epimerase [Burkholderiales bacterium]